MRRALPAVSLRRRLFSLKDGGFETRCVCRRTQSACPMFGDSGSNTSPFIFEWLVCCSSLAETAQCVYLRDGIANAQPPEATHESFHLGITHPK